MTKGTRVRGFTLIELIVFIVVAGIFIPMAYISFMAASRGSLTPERTVTARFLAETKMEDLTGLTYSRVPIGTTAYDYVTNDSRFSNFSMPTPNPYSGYQWKWEVLYVAYSDTPPHDSPVICARTSNPMVPQCNQWRQNTEYKIGDYIRPSGSTPNLLYRCIPPVKWQPSTPYSVASLVWPFTPSGFCYRPSALPWQANHLYVIGEFVEPTTPNGHSYRCDSISGVGISGSNPPVWPITSGATVIDGDITWIEAQPTSGPTEPSWSTVVGATVNDGSIRWITESFPVMRSGSLEPTWPTNTGAIINDGDLLWRESTTYKHIAVNVREPKGYEYIANSIVTARPGAYP
jgi:type II secretory pathway pseudopilin PulG